jgi:hypothetical protein
MEHCLDHSNLVETVGEIKGTVNLIKDSQEVMYSKIDKIIENGNNQKTDSKVNQEKIKPLFWAITVVAGYILLRVAEWSMSLVHFGKG